MDDLELNFSDALVDGGEVVCELNELRPSWAPLLEADALRVVADTASLRTASQFSPATPRGIGPHAVLTTAARSVTLDEIGLGHIQDHHMVDIGPSCESTSD
ncbi:hypothetical protein [Streptomyces platensis]|uniref:hypothetical protein n=1 Tax=Streptomyces platensis TaxID=58346 RepID=UPI00378B3ED9